MATQLRVLVIVDGPWLVAQVLEYDIGAEAKSFDDLMYQLQKTLVFQVLHDRQENREPFKSLEKAPRKFWEQYEAATPREAELPSSPSDPIPMPKTEVRVAA